MTSYTTRQVKAQEQNPFSQELISEVMPRSKTVAFAGNGNAMVNRETGEMMGDMAVIGIKKSVDSAEFVKLYERGIKAAFDLKPAALGVFSVLLEAYRKSKNTPERIYFTFRVAQRDFLYERTQKTFLSGINELLNRKFLAEVADDKGWYWVNPALFFKGDRLRIVNEYVTGEEAKLSHNYKPKNEDHAELEAKGQQRLDTL